MKIIRKISTEAPILLAIVIFLALAFGVVSSANAQVSNADIVAYINAAVSSGMSNAEIAAVASAYNVSAADITNAYVAVGASADTATAISAAATAAFEQVVTVTVNDTNFYTTVGETANVYTAPTADAGGTNPIGTFNTASGVFTDIAGNTASIDTLAAAPDTTVTASIRVGDQVVQSSLDTATWSQVVTGTVAAFNCLNADPTNAAQCNSFTGGVLTTTVAPIAVVGKTCTAGQPVTGVSCSEYAGSYGIDPTFTLGTLSYTLNSCGVLISADISDCHAPLAPTSPWITVVPRSPDTVIKIGGGLTATWGATGVVDYYVYKLDGTLPDVNVGTLTTWSGDPAALGFSAGPHSIGIKACNAGGCSLWASASFQVVQAPLAPVVTVNPNPVGSNAQLTAGWSPSPSGTVPVTSYKYRFDDSSLPVEAGTASTDRTLIKTPTELQLAGGTHTLKVQACNTGVCGPEGTKSFSVSALTVYFNWEPVPEASSYKLEIDDKTASAGWSGTANPWACSTLAGDVCYTETGTSKTLTGEPNKSYTIRVRACNTQGCSANTPPGDIVNVTCDTNKCSFSTSREIKWGTGTPPQCGAMFIDNGTLQNGSPAITLNSEASRSNTGFSGSVNLSCASGAVVQSNPVCGTPVVCPSPAVKNTCSIYDTPTVRTPPRSDSGEWLWTCSRTGAISANCSKPNSDPTLAINGPTFGNPDTQYSFIFTSTDADNDDVRFFVDWTEPISDGNADQFLPSATEYAVSAGNSASRTATHSWPTNGDHTFKVKVEDKYGGRTQWTPYKITLGQIQSESYIISATAGSGGSISPAGNISVARNASRIFDFIPDAGFRISSVVVDGTSRGIPSSFTFSGVTANHTINVTFEPSGAGLCVASSIIEARYDDNAPGTAGQLYSWNYNDPVNLATSQIYDGNIVSGGVSAGNKMVAVKLSQPLASAKSFTLYGNWGSRFSVGYADGGGTSASYFTATGGTVSFDGDYKVHKFTTLGDDVFTVTSGSGNAEVLVVAGGGGSGSDGSGGGGGGGVVYHPAYSVTRQAYAVRVGAGGTGNSLTPISGGNSIFDTILALGGGPASDGGYRGSRNGGSGGGGAIGQTGGLATQGNSGGGTGFGSAGGASSAGDNGGGGGGAGAVGATTASGGKGGDGVEYSISGTPTYYGGGGGGGIAGSTTNTGGLGGGGQGGNSTTGNTDGTANTGGGAGGGSAGIASQTPKNGGSGIVIVRYRYQDPVSTTASSFAIYPAVNGKTTWNLGTDGPLTLNTAGTWTITPSSSFSINAEMWGAGGGAGGGGAVGGGGGYSTGTVSLTSGTTYQLIVGEGGLYQDTSSPSGYGYGGRGSSFGGQGGGGTAIAFDSTNVPVLVAGGGGGGGAATGNAGAGGGAIGQSGSSSSGGGAQGITPGVGVLPEYNATAWGTSSAGGNGGWGTYSSGGGGGGYAGGGAMDDNTAGGGGGGSGYFSATYVTGGSTLVGSGSTPANSTDTDRGTAGGGSSATATRGGAGLIKISTPSAVAVVNGACGTANGTAVSSAPSANLCSAGSASAVSGTGPWNWTCSGSGGGTNASCSAPVVTTTSLMTATGGAVTTEGNFKVHKFTTIGTDTFTVTSGSGNVAVKMWGAGGGSGFGVNTDGGGGGYSTGSISVSSGSSYTITVGGGGGGGGGTGTGGTAGTGGGGGGGSGGVYGGAGGGGRSGIASGATQILIAGGGGGAGGYNSSNGGAGGGPDGQGAAGGSQPGGGGSQSAGGASSAAAQGSSLQGGTAPSGESYAGGGGGGGYFGGGAGGHCSGSCSGGGGGGSGYFNTSFVTVGSTAAGSWSTPANSVDADRGSAGTGGANGGSGQSGIVILRYQFQ